MSFFNALADEKEPVAFPEKTFDPAGTPTAEKKQCAWCEERKMIPLFNYGRERIHTVSHVGVAADEIDCSEGVGIGVSKHDAPP